MNSYHNTYDEKNDRSIFEFDTDQGTAFWPFDGDLLDQFSAGDSVILIYP